MYKRQAVDRRRFPAYNNGEIPRNRRTPVLTQLEQLPIPLLLWYRDNARVLPWRSAPTPYGVWVSEIMLQPVSYTHLDVYKRQDQDAQ